MALPYEPLGYAVNLKTGVVHKRHAWHASHLRRTTAEGVVNLLGARKAILCGDCWTPPPKPVKAAKEKASKPKAEPKTEERFSPEPVQVIPSAEEIYAEVWDGEDGS